MEESQGVSKIFSVRIVSIDYYMAPPIPDFDISYSSFQGGNVKEVPIIRVYGSTPAGQKACMHVHRALPYFYIPCSDIPIQSSLEGKAYENAVALAVEKALKLKGNAGSKRQHVHGCSVVRAKKFYGYHSAEELFVKIYLYYPNDIARAANLLLGGAVFEKSLQPFESHIPFLLQFMVDYNLFGMGHMHLLKMKFRQLVLDDLKNTNHINLDAVDCRSSASQAGATTSEPSSSLIWTASTIPHNWVWRYPAEPDASSNKVVNIVKRQSICELEGDTIVDDILNQQYKMFSSLSQTLSDVRMVQSLIPIWEEEFERTGVRETEILVDSGKPHPQDVLKTLSNGVEYENKLREVYSSVWAMAEEDVRHMVPAQCFIEDHSLVGMGTQCKDEQALGSSEAIDKAQPEVLQNSEDRVAVGALSGEREGLDFKATDPEDLALLKWLASSQAAEEINSDDELHRDTILNPLLPTASIDKVLEKANVDYENESQQECQDILDSMEDLSNSDDKKDKDSPIGQYELPRALPDKIIPQCDGAGDDEPLASAANSSDTAMDIELVPSKHDTLPHGNSGFDNKRKRLWGSLPLSQVQQVNDSIRIGRASINKSDKSNSMTKNDAFIPLDCEAQNFYDRSPKSSDAGGCSVIGSRTLSSCSVRDLMRKKRCFQVELSGRGRGELDERLENEKSGFVPEKLEFLMPLSERNVQPAEVSTAGQIQMDRQTGLCETGLSTSTCSPCAAEKQGFGNSPTIDQEKELDFGMPSLINSVYYVNRCGRSADKRCLKSSDSLFINDHLRQSFTSCSSCFSNSEGKGKICVEDDGSAGEVADNGERCAHLHPGMALTNMEGLDPSLTQFGKVGIVEQYASCSLELKSVLGCMEEREPPGCISMTFHKKPPIVSLENDTSESAMPLPVPSNLPCLGYSCHDEETSAQVGALGNVLPFFTGSNEKVTKQTHGFDDLSLNFSMGVPTHHYNDGSHAYLLTPAISPPSADCVLKWLAYKDKGHACKEPLPEPCQGSPEPINSQQGRNRIKINIERYPFSPELKACKVWRSPMKAKEGAKFSQDISQISGPSGQSKDTPLSQTGFRDPASVGAGQQLTLLSVEVQAESRGELRSDPQHDPVNIIVIAVQNDNSSLIEIHVLLRDPVDACRRGLDGISNYKVLVYPEEKELLDQFIHITRSVDPDILMGWDVQGSSLGFLAERAAHLGVSLLNKISRTPSEMKNVKRELGAAKSGSSDVVSSDSLLSETTVHDSAIIEDEWGRTHASGVHVGGRIILNVWRLMRGEVKLNMYTIEAVAEAVLRRKVPSFHWKILNKWFSSGAGRARYRCVEYVVERAKLNLEILNQLDMINRTSELARVFGIDFFSVLSRGSQYRVESMLVRLAHTQNYILISPGFQQVASQPAMECLPLVMEPESGFYSDPVVVLDFQALYPSMIIAYNLCFCTCFGNVVPSKGNTLGVSSYSPDLQILKDLNQQILVTPNGVMYVPSEVRKGILPRLLEEILSTRIMVKQAMKKLAPSQQILHRIFNARQLALKLIANVTYGYTAAGFSGRMPCAELADSIVQCGRRTLEHAICMVNSNDLWNARVIYGDTDSMFVLLKGRTLKEAFQIGHEIASTVTGMNPNPVVLKMEKVYESCFLLTKKRYVGYSYESIGQLKPIFDAKGIETIRRDTCGAVAKIMEKSLRKYFEHQDISKVRTYLRRQWSRILAGRVSLGDFIFAKEVRLGTYSTRASSSLPPAAIVASKAIRVDPRAEPRYAERIPYVVVHGEPGARLVDMVVNPHELLAVDSPYRLNDLYYITKQIIPALQRVFGLVGADLSRWFEEMPRPVRDAPTKHQFNAVNSTRARIDHYYSSRHCVICGELVQAGNNLCKKCLENGPVSGAAMTGITSKLERDIQHLVAICRHCGGGDWVVESGVKCTSLACSVYYERRKVQKELRAFSATATEAGFYPRCMVEWF